MQNSISSAAEKSHKNKFKTSLQTEKTSNVPHLTPDLTKILWSNGREEIIFSPHKASFISSHYDFWDAET